MLPFTREQFIDIFAQCNNAVWPAQVVACLLVIPFLWSLVGGSAAFLLAVPQDWPLLASSLVAVYPFLRGRGSRRPAAA